MTHIPTKLLKDILEDPEYSICALYDFPGHICAGRITFHHAIIHASKQLQKKWAIVQACAKAHGVDNFQDAKDCTDEVLRWVALSRGTLDDLHSISKGLDYFHERKRLTLKYGEWKQRYPDYLINIRS